MQDTGGLPSPEVDDEDVYTLYALRFAATGRRASDNFTIRDVHDGPMPLDYNVWIARNRRRTVVVDTGFGPEASLRRSRPVLIDPIEGLARIGVDVDQIEDVVLTHLHYDHCGNLSRFPRARFHLQDGEAAYATGRCMCEPHLRAPFDVEDVVDLVRHVYAERVTFHNGDATPLPGISLHLMPGHTAGMQAVGVRTARGVVVLASDVSHYYANIVRRSPFVITLDAAATLQSYARLRQLAGGLERIVPGHDPLVRSFYRQIEIDGIGVSVLHEEPKGMNEASIAACEGYE